MDCWPASSRQNHPRLRPGPLHPPPHQRRLETCRSILWRPTTRQNGLECARSPDSAWATSVPSSLPWGPPLWVQSTLYRKSLLCVNASAFGSTLTLRTEAISPWRHQFRRRGREFVSRPFRCRFDRDRPAQAWPATLRLWMRIVPRPFSRPFLQTRLSLHLLHVRGVASGRNYPGVFSRWRFRRCPLGHAARITANSRWRIFWNAAIMPFGRS